MRKWLIVLLVNICLILLYILIISIFNFNRVVLNVTLPFLLYGFASFYFCKKDKAIWNFPVKTGVIYLLATAAFTIIMCVQFYIKAGSIGNIIKTNSGFISWDYSFYDILLLTSVPLLFLTILVFAYTLLISFITKKLLMIIHNPQKIP